MRCNTEKLTLYRPGAGSLLPALASGDGLCAHASELVELSLSLGLSGNLWQNYLTWYLISHENPFSLSRERQQDQADSLQKLALRDMSVFRALFHMDSPGADDPALFEILKNFSLAGNDNFQLTELRKRLDKAKNDWEFLSALTDWYETQGVGEFGLYRSFRVDSTNGIRLCPLKSGEQRLDSLVGYALQKESLRNNTAALLAGKPAANVLLYGDAGTGKSSAVRALLNEWQDSSLRLVELSKQQLGLLGSVSAICGKRNYKFILFIDDLSFEEQEVEYKQLKAAMEGSAEERPDNLRIYATSNRRHLIRESWSDRSDMEHDGDIHRSDTMEEKLSLAGRFGLAINFSSPNPVLYHEIVRSLAAAEGIAMDDEALLRLADTFSIRKGGMTGRAARQFVDSLLCR